MLWLPCLLGWFRTICMELVTPCYSISMSLIDDGDADIASALSCWPDKTCFLTLSFFGAEPDIPDMKALLKLRRASFLYSNLIHRGLVHMWFLSQSFSHFSRGSSKQIHNLTVSIFTPLSAGRIFKSSITNEVFTTTTPGLPSHPAWDPHVLYTARLAVPRA